MTLRDHGENSDSRDFCRGSTPPCSRACGASYADIYIDL